MTKRFKNLTVAQERVFEQVAVGNDAGHNPKTLEALVSLGLLQQRGQLLSHGGVHRIPSSDCIVHTSWGLWRVLRLQHPSGIGLGGGMPVAVKRYDVPTPVHMEWCAWCDEHVDQDVGNV